MSMPADCFVEETRDGVTVRIRVRPRAGRSGVSAGAGRLQVAVNAAPEKGKATTEALETLALWMGVRRSAVTLASGATSRDKRAAVAGHTASDLRKRIAERLGAIGV